MSEFKVGDLNTSFRPYQAQSSQAFDLDYLRALAARYKQLLGLSNEFSYYQRFLDILKANRRCDIRPLKDISLPLAPDNFMLCLRHDMDVEPFSSLHLSAALFNAGLSGSFYVLHTAEYYGQVVDDTFLRYSYIADLLRQVQNDHGCEIGLHNDGLWVYQQWGMDGSQAIDSEIQWLRSEGINVVGTAAHNSAPIYGAENFELFEGRAALDRHKLARNEQIVPLQVLREKDLGLIYEANYPDVSKAQLDYFFSRYLSGLPADGIRNSTWMRTYLLNNPLCRWGHDYNIWLLGLDRWVIAGHPDHDPLFIWNATLDDIGDFLGRVLPQKRVICHVHPVYILSPGEISSPTLQQRLESVEQNVEVLAQTAEDLLPVIELSEKVLPAWRRIKPVVYFPMRSVRKIKGFVKSLLERLLIPLLVISNLFLVAMRTLITSLSRRPKHIAHGNKILMLTISQIDIDPRINKVVRSLVAGGYEVDILCYQSERANGVQEDEAFPGTHYVRIPHNKYWKVSLIFQEEFRRVGLSRQYDYVHVNDLTTLFYGWVLARARGVPLIYDAHEMWSENVQWNGKDWVPMYRWVRFLAFHFERFLVKDVDLFTTVSNSIRQEFKRRYHLSYTPLLVANYPSLSLLDSNNASLPSIRDVCNLCPDHFVTLYLGGVNPLRNIENVILAHQFLPEKCVFVIRGPAVEYFESHYKAMAQKIGVENQIFCLPPVGMQDLLAGAKGADCGILMLRDICKNFYWYYPNKFFEYMLAGLPVAVSNFPDVSAHIEKEQCGITFDPDSPESIAKALLWLYEHREEANAMGERGRAGVLREYNWEAMIPSLLHEYSKLWDRYQ